MWEFRRKYISLVDIASKVGAEPLSVMYVCAILKAPRLTSCGRVFRFYDRAAIEQLLGCGTIQRAFMLYKTYQRRGRLTKLKQALKDGCLGGDFA
jgi:hypothetical protein